MKKLLSKIIKPLIAFTSVITVLAPSAAFAVTPINVPLTASSQASANNIVVTSSGTSVRVQFDYALVNGATTATVDAALNDNFSLGQTVITGSGHFDVTISNLANATYTVYIISSGNDDYLVPKSAGSTQPLQVVIGSSGDCDHSGKDKDHDRDHDHSGFFRFFWNF